MLGAAVGCLIFQHEHKREARPPQHRDGHVAEAMDDYRDKQFDQATGKFRKLAGDWPNDPVLGTQAHAWALLSQGRADLAAGRYPVAQSEFEQVDETHVFDNNRDTIQGYRNQASSGAAFADLRAKIDALITAGKFGEARQRIDDARRIGPTPEESARLNALAEKNEDQALRARVAEVIARSGEMEKSGQRDQAIASLTLARRRFPQLRCRPPPRPAPA